MALWAILIAPLAGALVGFICLTASTHQVDVRDFRVWFAADCIGNAVLIPFVWAHWGRAHTHIKGYDPATAFALSLSSAVYIFWQTKYPFLFLAFPSLLLVVFRSKFRGATRVILTTTIVGTIGTVMGHGPFALTIQDPAMRILLLQFFIGVIMVTSISFALVLIERNKLFQQLQESEARYRQQATLDSLTHLANRREFDRFLRVGLQRASRDRTSVSLLLIDADHFKRLNDTFGHSVGDIYLKRIAAEIEASVPRATDMAARYGGEEFAVVLTNCEPEGAEVVARRIHARIMALSPALASSYGSRCSVSIGQATCTPILYEPALERDLIDAADTALYRAKSRGRNRIEFAGAPVVAIRSSV